MTVLRRGDQAAYRDALVERRARLALAPMLGEEDAAREQAAAQIDGQLTTGSELWQVEGGGYAWLFPTGDVLEVGALELDDVSAAQPVRRDLVALAAARGATQLGIESFPGDPATTAAVDDPRFGVSATNMVLDVAVAAPQSRLVLDPMDDAGYAAYSEEKAVAYAEERLAAGIDGTPEQHLARARESSARLLPQGRHTPGHHFWRLLADDGPIGTLWLAERSARAGYVYDVVVDEAHRGRGLGRAAMDAGAAWCREQGLDLLGLNVFGHNVVARSLYDALGYAVVLDYLVADPGVPAG